LKKTLEITKVGHVDINGSLHTTGRVDIDKELNIGGEIILHQSPLNVPNELKVSHNITANRDIDVKGSLNVLGNTDISGNLNVGGYIGSSRGFKTTKVDNDGYSNGWGKDTTQSKNYNPALGKRDENWNVMSCPPGNFVSAIKTTSLSNDGGFSKSSFAVECSKLDTVK
jgi:hypothetical protein